MVGNPLSTVGRVVRQYWRDLLSVYYANTPVWRWLKSAALVFLGFFAWMGGAVLLSVQPGWTFLHYVMAYGLLVVIWGPFTHFVVVPLAIRLRRSAEHPITRTFSRNSGKINLAIFFTLVAILGTVAPGFMVLEFDTSGDGGGGADATGDLVCDIGETTVSCEIMDASGFDSVVVTSDGDEIVTVDEPPYTFEFEQDVLAETRTGKEYVVTLQDENGDRLRRFVRTIPG